MVRPEDVRLTERRTGDDQPDEDGALPGEVVRLLPHGHFTEVLVEARGHRLRAYRNGTPPEVGAAVGVRFDRALHYRDGRLVGGPESG